MRLRQAVGRVRNAEVAVSSVGAQAVGQKILVAVMTDGDALLRTRALGDRQPARLGLAILGLDGFSRRRFVGDLARNAPARRFFLRGESGPVPSVPLLLGH